MIEKIRSIKTKEAVIIEPVPKTDELNKDNDSVSLPIRSISARNTANVRNTAKRKEKVKNEIDKDYGKMFCFLWASIHEPQLVQKVSIKPCVKPSTEVWLNDLHTHLFGHNGNSNTGGVSPFHSPGQNSGTPLDQ